MSDRELWTQPKDGNGWEIVDLRVARPPGVVPVMARVVKARIGYRALVFGPSMTMDPISADFETGTCAEANIRAAMNWAVSRLAELGWYPDAERCDAQNAKAANFDNVSMVAAALRSMGQDEMQLMIDPSSGSAENRTVCDRLVARGLFVWRDRGGATERLVRTPLGRAVTDALVAAERFEYHRRTQPVGPDHTEQLLSAILDHVHALTGVHEATVVIGKNARPSGLPNWSVGVVVPETPPDWSFDASLQLALRKELDPLTEKLRASLKLAEYALAGPAVRPTTAKG